jgi:NAD(P)-dependent dehydrogenase (short-subunit alcohol dehydrogenase family)
MRKIAMVTGAGSGIGKACALGLLKDGWHVILVGRRANALQAAIDAAGSHSDHSVAMVADLSREEEVQTLFEQVRTRFGRLDLLFNNAGIFLASALPSATTGEDWRRVIDINLNGAFYALSAAFKLMQEQQPQGGRIINNGSISAHAPRPGSIAYAASKHAVTGMTRSAALDGRAFNIAVGQMDIGNVLSDMTAQMTQGMRQADGSIKAEACMDMTAVVDTFLTMARLPLTANILFTTVMATNMPYVGRG